MSQISTALKLHLHQLATVDATIREHHYVRIDEAVAALAVQGIVFSRSALHRYSKALKRRDGVCPTGTSGTVVVIMHRASGRTWTVLTPVDGEELAAKISAFAAGG